MKVTLLGKVFRWKCAHFPAFSSNLHKMCAFLPNLHKMCTFSWKCVHFHLICIKCVHFHLICIKCTHFPNLNLLRFRWPINIGLYERPITLQRKIRMFSFLNYLHQMSSPNFMAYKKSINFLIDVVLQYHILANNPSWKYVLHVLLVVRELDFETCKLLIFKLVNLINILEVDLSTDFAHIFL